MKYEVIANGYVQYETEDLEFAEQLLKILELDGSKEPRIEVVDEKGE